ncbi:hypothetical protein HG15A2_20630 [Adhaeretor mobilis]|uniref:Uncharacterized protein n=1 Tax=Adhaeretor mobilis TaxID=1930276 RepID=A0A517MV80_9BACT|nr:hypothetical protein HG15A2_20630 [Adhaeretor mobilis]
MEIPAGGLSDASKQVEREHAELRELFGTIHKSLATPASPILLVREQPRRLCGMLESHLPIGRGLRVLNRARRTSPPFFLCSLRS